MALIYFSFIYKLSKKTSTYQGEYLRRISDLNPIIFNMLKDIKQNQNPFYDKDLFKRLFRELNTDKLFIPFYGRILASYQSTYASQIFLNFCFVTLFIYFGWMTINNSTSWTSVIVFLVALRYAGQSINKVSNLGVNISKFYPALRIFKEYVAARETNPLFDDKIDSFDRNEFAIHVNKKHVLPNSQKSLNLVIKRKYMLFCSNIDNDGLFSNSFQTYCHKLFNSRFYCHGRPGLINGISLVEKRCRIKYKSR